MPFIVEITYPAPDREGLYADKSRRAVATLDPHRRYRAALTARSAQAARRSMSTLVAEIIGLDHDPPDTVVDIVADAIDGHSFLYVGGTIGPLPDGTVVEVRNVVWEEVADACGYAVDHDSDEIDETAIIDRYNAAQGAHRAILDFDGGTLYGPLDRP